MEEETAMARFQVIYRSRGTTDPWESMGTTFDNHQAAIDAAAEYNERWSDREHTVLGLTAERCAELAAETPDHGRKGGEVRNEGCGEPVYVIGTNGGTMPCGATLRNLKGESAPYLCERCKPAESAGKKGGESDSERQARESQEAFDRQWAPLESGCKGGEVSSEEFPRHSHDRARIVLDAHSAMTRRSEAAVESRIVDLIADLLLLADRWNLPTGRILERASAQAFPMPETGRKGGSASSLCVDAPSAGIDYGLGTTNIDIATSIRYGVISQHSLMGEALEGMEPDYGDPHCPECGGNVLESSDVKHYVLWTRRMDRDGTHGCFDYACLACRQGFDSDACFSDEPIGYSCPDDEYELQSCLDSDIMVLKSPFYTHAQFCSPCVPGGGNLDSPMVGGVRAFALGHDWFEGGVAPYPVYRVSDDSVVAAEEVSQ